ncbi:hypothetical protein CTA1_9087 [Colletotrichum tanaceti]|uniref:Uncharacterized protein n=1 Tax=Colletotrichum tanaceti TaxID=1306861 RepID=A0A4U6XN72_9PEZI|nr:hypothetical protein CTA1_9087 [Colletotrichum tanaceti]
MTPTPISAPVIAPTDAPSPAETNARDGSDIDTDTDTDTDAVVIGRDDVSDYNPGQILPAPPETMEKLRASWVVILLKAAS